MRQSVIEKFKPIVRAALNEHISSAVDARLRSALMTNSTDEDQANGAAASTTDQEQSKASEVTTTEEELNGYYIVKAILRDSVDPKRITARDVQSYFGILLDDNNRKPVCRLHFNRSQKYLGIFDSNKAEVRIPIDSVDDLFKHADRIRESLGYVLD